ncbi:Protein ndrg3 [Tyrophagus putrescentiae]|nr:Protein ndrg3 [Tyrophagus putrescentiae]
MPIYYKKVNHDAAELGLIESGLGTTSSTTSTNGHQNSSPTSNGSSFLSGVQKKLASASGFGGSRSSLFGVGSNGSEVELERISSSFHVESEDHLDDLHLGGGSSPSNSKRAPFLLKSKATNEDRDRLMTKYGPIVVVKQLPPPSPMNSSSSNSTEPIQNGKGTSAAAAGAPPVEKVRPVILTYHDIGLNYFSNFESFFSRLNVRTLLSDFRIFHLNAPGQEEAADGLPETSTYQFPINGRPGGAGGGGEFIGFGYGAGANVLSRFALSNADMVEALFLVNPSATTSTWAEWFYQKLNIRALNQPAIADPSSSSTATGNTPTSLNTSGHDHTLPPATQEYFIWHLFGNTSLPDRVTDEEAVAFYRRYLDSGVVNRRNLAHFIESYIGRPALGISRDDKLNNFKCPGGL